MNLHNFILKITGAVLILCMLPVLVFSVDLSETDTVMMMLENNVDVQNADIDILIAQKEKDKAVSMFMPEVSFSNSRIFDENYTQNYISGTLTKLFSTGTAVSISGGMTDLDFESAFLPDKENSSGSVSIRQALLRDSFGRASRRITGLARLGIELTELRSLYLKEEMIHRTVDLYWMYVLLVETVRAEQERLKYYDDLLKLVEKKRGFGAAEKRDVLITRSALLQSRNSLRQAVYQKENLEINLRLLISPENTMTINPVYAGENLGTELPIPSESEKVTELLMKRTDFRLIATQLEMATMKSEMNTSMALPQIDLILGYGTDGVDMFQQGFISPDPLDPAYMIGISFSYRFGGSQSSAEAGKDYFETLKLKNQFRLQQQEAVMGYIDSVKRYKTALEIYETSGEILKVNQDKIDNEMEELKKGRSTFERLVEFENMYIGARLSFYRSLGDLRRAAVILRKNMGTLVTFYADKGVFSNEETY